MPTGQNSLVPNAVFGHEPFCEIGTPSLSSEGPHGMIAVGGSLGPAQWNGYDIAAGPVHGGGPLQGWNRCGVYDTDANCLSLVRCRWPVRCASFSRDGSVLAVGTGSYDGGFFFEGQLLIVDPLSGRSSSVLEAVREVLSVDWLDDRVLRIVVSPACEEDEPQEPSQFDLSADDWLAVEASSVSLDAEPKYVARSAQWDPFHTDALDQVETRLDQIAATSDPHRRRRRQVWDVEATRFGVLATLEGVELEAWEESGMLRYRHTTDTRGRQIERINADVVVTNAEPDGRTPVRPFERPPSTITIRSVDDGRTVAEIETTQQVVVASASGRTLLRPSTWWRRSSDDSSVIDDVGHLIVDGLALGGYDLFNHYFAIRRAPHLFALQGDPGRPSQSKWVVELAERGLRNKPQIKRLFALEWDSARNGHLQGGPGVFVDGGTGRAIVHVGHVHNGAGLQPGDAFVVRRRYPSGELEWQYTTDCQATAIDEQLGTVHVCFADGRLVRLDSTTGAITSTQLLRVDGHPVVPLSLSCRPDGALYVGTMDGRILVVG